MTKKPIFDRNYSDTCSLYHCECGNRVKVFHDVGTLNNNDAPNYCCNCGCRFDWKSK
nr:MAG TPA: cysteine-rich protein [Caudoviricetes sp.]